MKRLFQSLMAMCAMALTVVSGVAHAGKQAGGIIISQDDYAGYIRPELVAMRADVAKFHLSYDGDWAAGYPAYFILPASYLTGAISAGVKDIIVRTADTKVSRNEVNHFIQGMRFSDTGERLVDFIYNHRNEVHVWIEVGNEPDNANPKPDPWVYRWHLIDVANNIIPQWTWLWTMHWIASAPAYLGSYTDIFYTVNGEGSVQSKYEAIGTHEYADFDFNYNVTNKALSLLPAGKIVWVTEAGINHSYDWATKGVKYRDATRKYAADSRVRGWTFFLLSKSAYWNTCPNGDGTCMRYGIDLNYNTMTAVSGRPAATAISGR